MEIALSACIIGVLLAITSPFFLSYREQARVVVAVNEIKTVEAEVFKLCCNKRRISRHPGTNRFSGNYAIHGETPINTCALTRGR